MCVVVFASNLRYTQLCWWTSSSTTGKRLVLVVLAVLFFVSLHERLDYLYTVTGMHHGHSNWNSSPCVYCISFCPTITAFFLFFFHCYLSVFFCYCLRACSQTTDVLGYKKRINYYFDGYFLVDKFPLLYILFYYWLLSFIAPYS